MRWLFLLLLIGNLAFFTWNYFDEGNAAPIEKSLPKVKTGTAHLQLLSELTQDEMPSLRGMVGVKEEAQDEPRLEEEPESEPEVEPEIVQAAISEEKVVTHEPQRLCYRVTDIVKQKHQENLLRAIEDEDGKLLSRGETQIQLKKYWVMLPPYKSRSAAIAAIEQLKETKVKDYYRIRSGDYANAISLGLFSSYDTAKRRVREVRKYKLTMGNPKLEEIELPAKRFWLVFSGEPDIDVATWNSSFEKLEIGQFKLAEEVCAPEHAE